MAESVLEQPAGGAGAVQPRPAEPDQEFLVEESRARRARAFERRDFVATILLAGAFVAATAVLLVWLPVRRPGAGFGVTLALVLCFAVAARVQFEAGFAIAVPTQLVLVPMLFLTQLRLVPVLVALGYFLSKLPEHIRGQWHIGRAGLHLVSAWYSIGPVLVLAAAKAPTPILGHLPILALALAAQFGLDFASSAVRGCFALGVSPKSLLRALGPAWLVDFALTPLGFALAYVSRDQPYAFLLGLPMMALLAYFARERKSRIDHALELSNAYRGTALLLGDMVGHDDAYTGVHSQDVVSLVLGVSDRLGLDPNSRREAEFTALLHDVGKVTIPNEIINKPGPLTAEERAIVNLHTIEGERMLEKVGGLLGDIGHLVRSCHERWDGGGYPDGLAREGIPLVARIVCACDAFSAMTTDRSYRQAMSRDEAFDELRRCSGTQFDPNVVEALFAVADVA